MRLREIAILLFCASAVTAVCEAGGQYLPITDLARRIEIPGVSVLPPRGGTWFLFPVLPEEHIPTNALIRLVRRLEGGPPARPEDARMVVAAVTVMDSGEGRIVSPAEFLQAFTGADPKKSIGQMMTPRQRLIGFDAALDDSLTATCASYSRLTEITGQFPAFQELIAITSTRGLYCAHPHWPQYRIDAIYQQVYAKGQEPLFLDTEADNFFRTLAFTDTRPVAVGVAPAPAPSSMMAGSRPTSDIPRPRKLKDVPPDYPKDAQLALIQGDVVLEATIGADGKVQDTRVLLSIPQLDQAVIDAVRQWEYTPTVINGQAVTVIMTVTVSFRLQ